MTLWCVKLPTIYHHLLNGDKERYRDQARNITGTPAASPAARLDALNGLLLDPDTRVVNDLLDVIAKYGTPEEINRKAAAARQLDNLLLRLAEHDGQYLDEIKWLTARARRRRVRQRGRIPPGRARGQGR